MKFNRRRAISPIIATLLLIAIAVAAGIIVYVFVNGLAGNLTQGGGAQVVERLQIQAFNFVISPVGGTSCTCSGEILEIFLSNSGTASSTISAVYYDGTIQTLAAGPITGAGTDVTPTTGNAYYDSSAATLTSTAAGKFGFSAAGSAGQLTYAVQGTGQIVIAFTAAPTSGGSHTVKIVSSTGATSVFTVTAGRSG